jgi:alkylation response protein AidB-like acyl-CoA dehydrogenase
MKRMVKEAVEFCVPRTSMLEPYYKHDFVRERIGKMATKTLIAESMLYSTCGLIDSGEYPEFQLESAATKVRDLKISAFPG